MKTALFELIEGRDGKLDFASCELTDIEHGAAIPKDSLLARLPVYDLIPIPILMKGVMQMI